MNEQSTYTEKEQPRCLVIHPLGGDSCERPAVAEFHGLHYCEVHGREIEAAMRVDLGVQAYKVLCRWTEEADILANPVLAEILKVLKDARREAVAELRRAERDHEEARNASWQADPLTLLEKIGA